MKSNASRYWIIVLAAALVATVLRAMIAYNGSIWADEGTFLGVIAAPTMQEMISFLKYHESHPPLFYLIMREWSRVAKVSDIVLMIMPLLLSVAMVPAMFIAGRKLFSARTGTIAAIIAAVAPQLTEHASQFRPYGLLSLCALGSAAALLFAIDSPTRRAWMLYVVSTAAMLYTHNWGWMIVAGELGAALVTLFHLTPQSRRAAIRGAALSWIAILALYSIWIPSFVYQSGHAGHRSLPIESALDYLGYLFFSSSVIVESLVVGRHTNRQIVAIACMSIAIVAFLVARRLYRQRDEASGDPLRSRRAKMSMNIALFALLAALALSPFNNLILPRTVATVAPMLILALAYFIDRLVARAAPPWEIHLGAAVLAFALAGGAFRTAELIRRPRSNAGRIADAVSANSRPNDLLIFAPESYVMAFDHYFPPSIEQIDYPHSTRSPMIDFSNMWLRTSQSAAPEMIRERIEAASRKGQRIWLVIEHRYARPLRSGELEEGYRHKRVDVISARDIQRIRATLETLYGKPKRTLEAKHPPPLIDEMVAYLYAR